MTTSAVTPVPALSMPPADDDAGWETFLRSSIDDRLATAHTQLVELRACADGDQRILDVWNDLQISLSGAGAAAGLFAEVLPSAERREQAEAGMRDVQKFLTDLMLDADVFARLDSLAPRDDPDAARVLSMARRDFRRAGVDRDEPTRERVKELARRETELGQAFARGIRDGRTITRVPLAALAGLPADWVDTHPADADGMVEISTDYPDTVPFLVFSEDAEARRAVAHTAQNLGWPDNDEVLRELLSTRREHAQLLGYADWAEFDCEIKMIGRGAAIMPFIDATAEAAAPAAQRDFARLRERAARSGEDRIDLANWRHWAEVIRREEYGVDAQEVRRYFDFAKVREGLLDVTARLFGVTYVPVAAPNWHADVATYDVDLDGERIGRIHLDLHPRPGKFNHAAQFELTSGVRGRQLAEGVLVCNFGRGLMEHSEVVTLFHEFGHLMHHVLGGRQDWVRFSGVATEWDFVEAPSQMLEEWAWDADVLATFATDADGNPIPADLVERMRGADEFATGVAVRRQLFLAALSYELYARVPDDITALTRELADRYSEVGFLDDTHFHCSFGHLDGYGPGYYTYMWSLVIAKDLFSAFDADDLFAPEIARRYRDKVLAPGGSRDAADLVTDFLGRPYDERAFAEWLAR